MPRMEKKKLHTWEFQLKHSNRNMRCKLLQKRFTGKTSVPNTRGMLPLKKIFYQNRCIFQIPLKYIKFVIPKILFILVLCSFNFYFKITWPPPPSPPPPFRKDFGIFNPPPAWGACPESSIKTKSLNTKPCPTGLSPRIICQASPCQAPTKCGLLPLPLNLYG